MLWGNLMRIRFSENDGGKIKSLFGGRISKKAFIASSFRIAFFSNCPNKMLILCKDALKC